MNCSDARDLIHAYADDELDVATVRQLDSHLVTCPACARAFEADRAVKTALCNPALYQTCPEDLQKQVLVALSGGSVGFNSAQGRNHHAASAVQDRGVPGRRHRFLGIRGIGLAAALLLAIGAVWAIQGLPIGRAAGSADAHAVLAAHLRSLQPGNSLLGVVSTSQHTVKPWLDQRLDFAPPVKDLTSQGFPLQGARLDYLDDRPVAAIVYQHGKHTITLFVWPDGKAQQSAPTIHGWNLVHWTSNGMSFWAVSDISSGDLEQFAQLLRN